ncbi:hypothetical protein M0L20_23480 [Spirosoma sp. RP8]|uniref:Uncharacterized protein n=1 Tax=Spirosoma liriopis TaxID=2937440 RepID=A0ABT0HRP3_9BACT|nr:hypothetical protein [Spirosoma liriopis]MCK8494851.1 hypothetical protein [Spirosoma liriopis]
MLSEMLALPNLMSFNGNISGAARAVLKTDPWRQQFVSVLRTARAAPPTPPNRRYHGPTYNTIYQTRFYAI